MANTLKFKRGLVSTIPTAALGEPLFTTDTFDLYIGNGTGNTRFQKYIASGATTQILRGDGSLYTFPLAISSPSNGQVLKYNGTSWVNDSDAGITGSGTTNYLPKFTGASTLGNSLVFDDGTNVGIGTATPTTKLQVEGTASFNFPNNSTGVTFSRQTIGELGSIINSGSVILYQGTGSVFINADSDSNGTASNRQVQFGNRGTTYMTLDASGNLGLGVTPSAWNSPFKVIQIGESSSLWNISGVTGSSNNHYNDATNKYLANGFATIFEHSSGQFRWLIAPNNTSGAGASATFTQPMTLTANGRLLLGTTDEGTQRLQVAGDAYINNVGGSVSGLTIYGNDQSNVRLKLQNANGRTWDLTGGLTGANNNDFTIYDVTASATRFVINSSGNVGIGTTALTSGIPLTINAPTGANTNLAFQQNSSDKWYIRNITGTDDFSFYSVVGALEAMRLTTAGAATFSSSVTATNLYSTGASNFATSGGNVGIGTTSPLYQLVLNKDDNNFLQIRSSDAGNAGIYFGRQNDSVRGSIYYNNSTDALYFQTFNLTTTSVLHSTGNLHIGGTSDSGEKLQVTGTMKVTGASTFGAAGSFSGILNTTVGNGLVVGGTSFAFFPSATRGSLQIVGSTDRVLAFGTNGNQSAYIYSNASLTQIVTTPSFEVSVGGATRLTIASTGAATFSSSVTGASFIPNGSTAPTNGMYLSAANTLNFATNSGNRLSISSTGLVTFTDSAVFANLKGCRFTQTGGSLFGSISMDSSNAITIDNNGFFGLSIASNYTMTGGNLGIGHGQFGTSATKTISVNNGTAPSSSPTDSFQMYSNDVTAGNAAPHFRTENGAVIKLYQETTAVGNSTISIGGGSAVLDDTEFDGYTLRQLVRALRNQGILQ